MFKIVIGILMKQRIRLNLKNLLLHFVVFLSIVSVPAITKGQISIDSLERKANEFLDVKNDADSALKYYLQVRKRNKKFKELKILKRIAFCYECLEDTSNAIQFYIKSFLVIPDVFPLDNSQKNICRKLIEIYFAQKQYKNALFYDELLYSKFESTNGSFNKKIRLKDIEIKALCQKALKDHEGVQKTLKNYVFKSTTWFNQAQDTFNQRFAKIYTEAIFSQYGIKKSKEMFMQMFYGINVKNVEDYKSEFRNRKIVRITYEMKFGSSQIHDNFLTTMSYVAYHFQKTTEINQSLVWHIFQNPICRMILEAKES